MDKFERAGWVPFLEKIKEHHEGVSHAFAKSYDGESVHSGEPMLTITKDTIEESIELPSTGDKYFKCIIIDRSLCQKKLKLEHMDPYWTKGISRNWIKEEYWTMLVFLQNFLTYEGRYAVNFLYHLRLLLHFEGGPKMYFPHFLWMSLNEMVRGVKASSKKLETSLYHHGLMKLIVVHELRKQDNSWKKLFT
jgi:hypothetical protein